VNSVLITGAASGLGSALARHFAKKGYKLILTAREQKNLPEDLDAEWIFCDLSKDLLPITQAIEEKKPDLLINNAGFGFYGNFETLPSQEAMIDVNIKTPVCLAMHYVRVLKNAKKGGTVVNIASAAGYFAFPYFATYAASKTFLRYFSEAIDYELQNSGIRVLVTMLGQVDTPFRTKASLGNSFNKSVFAIDAGKAAALIAKQIEKKKRLSIIDWRCRIMVLFSRLLSKPWLDRLLARSILTRIDSC
jgi:short-subunit dehydrogenase